ncbi:MAG: nicotinate phosphoribosyltransferase [Frankiaceae bacterium]|nr:nicotinate phosphoribosyltransferase [Frankiaceae bacterium]
MPGRRPDEDNPDEVAGGVAMPSPAMLTDRYELTMVSSWLADGSAHAPAVFECFARGLPPGRRYGVVAGLGRLLPLIRHFRFTGEEIDYLTASGAVSDECADYLAGFRFAGDVDAYREGDLYFPGSPVLTVAGTLAECCLLETIVLSVLNHDSAIASAAARMVVAARDRPLIDMGSRRTHERAAIASARAAYLAGFSSTSNLAAGHRYGIPTVGTAAHSFTLSHASEAEAFASQVAALGVGTTLLVDTYNSERGIRTAVDVAGPDLGAIRLDSGALTDEAWRARRLLDELGATRTRITVTSDLDEYCIAELASAPVDNYGVGTRLVTGSGHPTASFVYKLVAVGDAHRAGPLRPVAKSSTGKASVGGRKRAFRASGEAGEWVSEQATSYADTAPGTALVVPVMRGGEIVHDPGLDEIRAFSRETRDRLPDTALDLSEGPPHLTASKPGRADE